MFQKEVEPTEGDEGTDDSLTYDEMIENMIRVYSNDQGGIEISAQFSGKVEAKGREAISQMLTKSDESRDSKSLRYYFLHSFCCTRSRFWYGQLDFPRKQFLLHFSIFYLLYF